MPSFEHWITVEAFYFVGAFVISLVLGILGIGHVKRVIIFILLVVSLGIMLLGLLSTAKRAEEETKLKQNIKTLTDLSTGGDNFAFFTAETNIAPNGENYLPVTTTGQMPYFDCTVIFLSTDGKIIDERGWYIRPLPKTTSRFSHITLPPGRYLIDCVMGEKKWKQRLEFTRTPDGINQTFRVEKNGQIVKEMP